MKNYTILIEGLPSAGKTTFLDHYSKEYDKGGCVKEIANELDKDEFFPGDSTDIDSATIINRWFLSKELERYQRATISLSKPYVLMDRGFITHLAYSYAFSKYFNTNIINITFETYIFAIQNNLLNIPNTLLIFDISPKCSLDRTLNRIYKSKRSQLPDFWKNKYFLKYIKEGYDIIAYELKSLIDVKFIDAEKSKLEVYNDTLNFIKLINESNQKSKIIDNSKVIYTLKFLMEQFGDLCE